MGVRPHGDRYSFLWIAFLDPNSKPGSPQYLEGTSWPRNALVGDLELQIEAIEDQYQLLSGKTVEVFLEETTVHSGHYTFTASSTPLLFKVIVKSVNKWSRLKDSVSSLLTMPPSSGPSGSMGTTRSGSDSLSDRAPVSTADQQHSTVGSSQASGGKPQYEYYR